MAYSGGRLTRRSDCSHIDLCRDRFCARHEYGQSGRVAARLLGLPLAAAASEYRDACTEAVENNLAEAAADKLRERGTELLMVETGRPGTGEFAGRRTRLDVR